MATISDKIMRRIRARGRGKWVCTPKDFFNLGNRDAVDQALSRLVKSGDLRRIRRGFYDWPRMSNILEDWAPADIDSFAAALARRDNVRIMKGGFISANLHGLTNAVPAQISYVTDGATRTLQVDGRTIYLTHAGPRVMAWDGKRSRPVAQALRWLGSLICSDQCVTDRLQYILPDYIKKDFARNSADLPGWAATIAHNLRLSDE